MLHPVERMLNARIDFFLAKCKLMNGEITRDEFDNAFHEYNYEMISAHNELEFLSDQSIKS